MSARTRRLQWRAGASRGRGGSVASAAWPIVPVDASRTTTIITTCADPKAISLGWVGGRAQRCVVCGQIVVSFARLGERQKDKGGAIAVGFYLFSLGNDAKTSAG